MSAPEAHLAEMLRVLRPGGRVALIDTDWRSLTLWLGDPAVTSGIRDAWAASCLNPAAGAKLGGLLGSAGFTEITTTADVLPFRSAGQTTGHLSH